MMPSDSTTHQWQPSIAALFVASFDLHKGYTLIWQRSLSSITLEGHVEYKSLPSGLHHVQHDLIHFTHESYAGISAFQSARVGQDERGARFIAVGALVPCGAHAHEGRAWLYASVIRDLARDVLENGLDEKVLEEIWEDKRGEDDDGEESLRQRGAGGDGTIHPARRSASEGLRGSSYHNLQSADHPALSMRGFIDTFGPLAFVLHRAALLRKRILIQGHAPVKDSCDHIYDLSVISQVTSALEGSLNLPPHLSSAKPLFSVGVHDIPELENASRNVSSGLGYLACTTDDILCTKTKLYDLVVYMQPNATNTETRPRWPTVMTSGGQKVKATQRDLRRFCLLRRELDRLHSARSQKRPTDHAAHDASAPRHRIRLRMSETTANDDMHEPLIAASAEDAQPTSTSSHYVPEESAIVEPASWTSIALDSMLWWASSGIGDLTHEQEAIQDASLVEDLVTTALRVDHTPNTARSRSNSASSLTSRSRDRSNSRTALSNRQSTLSAVSSDMELQQMESVMLTAFFHRLTSMYLEQMAKAIATANEAVEQDINQYDEHSRTDENEQDQSKLLLRSEDILSMGLDAWSTNDRQFVTEFAKKFFLRPADDERDIGITDNTKGLVVCGVRIY